jgi:hypothetical protein
VNTIPEVNFVGQTLKQVSWKLVKSFHDVVETAGPAEGAVIDQHLKKYLKIVLSLTLGVS